MKVVIIAGGKGTRISSIANEIPKSMIMIGIRDEYKDDIVSVILRVAKSPDQGAFGDGKIFITPMEEAYTISTGEKGI